VVKKRRYIGKDGTDGPTVVTESTTNFDANANVSAADKAAYEARTGTDTSAGGRRLL